MDNNLERLNTIFLQQKECWIKYPNPDYKSRINNLKRLKNLLLTNQQQIIQAINQDFGCRSASETKVLEIFPSIEAINYAIKNLKTWMKPRKVKTSIWFWPSKSYIYPQSKGVVGIISPWNYPLFITIAPLVCAIAAGNRVMLKLSEHSTHTSSLIKDLFAKIFVDSKVSVVLGNADIAAAFSSLPFDHLLYTGSTAIGKQVMRAASDNLTPVTLELGGKSPVVLLKNEINYNFINKIWFGKVINSGQTCLAPDYVWMPRVENYRVEFLKYSKQVINTRFNNIDQYTSIINKSNYDRILKLIKDAIAKGGIFEPLIKFSNNDWHTDENNIYKIAPGIIFNVSHTMDIMQEEIFGPVLPIIEYDTIEQLLFSLQIVPKALAIYIFSNNKKIINKLLDNTTSGAFSINATIIHAAQEALPFGGLGNSGMGVYRGKSGFDTFSVLKPVYKQSKVDMFSMFYPPVRNWQKKLLNYMIK